MILRCDSECTMGTVIDGLVFVNGYDQAPVAAKLYVIRETSEAEYFAYRDAEQVPFPSTPFTPHDRFYEVSTD